MIMHVYGGRKDSIMFAFTVKTKISRHVYQSHVVVLFFATFVEKQNVMVQPQPTCQ